MANNIDLCIDSANAFMDIGIYSNELDREASTQSILFRTEAFYSIPAVVNISFACELYLKAICMQNGVSFNRQHNLVDLFNLLPDDIQDKINSEFSSRISYMTLDQLLKIHSQAFVKWRYIYEDANTTVEAYPDNLILFAEILYDIVKM